MAIVVNVRPNKRFNPTYAASGFGWWLSRRSRGIRGLTWALGRRNHWCIVDANTARQILADCITNYRLTSHADLASRLRASSDLDVINGIAADGTEYTIEVNLLWDDEPLQHIRVMADLWTGSRGSIFGFIPVYVADAADCFIMTRDGSFIGE